jgi:adenylosuccinate synthase
MVIENVDIVLGCSYGDEGKGKVVNDLLKKLSYNLCIRFNGSGNAGHTIYQNSKKVVIHQLPIGILHNSVYNLISSDCLIDIGKLEKELEIVKNMGIDVKDRLFVSKACHIITQDAIDYDKAHNKIGTTGSGIGPTYSNKMLRISERVEDYKDRIEELGIKIVNMREFWKSDFVKSNIKNVLLEGAQGFELDINWTENYPYCTSSTCTIAGAINTGIPMKKIRNIYGISKAYDTYVGTRNFQPIGNSELELIGRLGKEYGATTGRKRQCNYLNLDKLYDALLINQCNVCIINKFDIVDESKIYKLYSENNLLSFNSLFEMKKFITKKLDFVDIIFSSNPYEI